MKNNIIQLQHIEKNKKWLGAKTLNLKKSIDEGFNVPRFVAVPSFFSNELHQDITASKRIAQEIDEILQCEKYSVRSSALIEDGRLKSFAGQFETKLNLSSSELANGINEVIDQANNFLKGELDKFSMIIQEYIESDISGISFTRNPSGSREMIIEYGFCEGGKIVSGEIKPEKISLFWNDKSVKLPKFLETVQLVQKMKSLEKNNQFPQDVEWCIKDKVFYLLQTRPITTITDRQYGQIKFLERQLAQDEKYFLEKTEISEIAPRPTEITLDLLQLIYSQHGPVAQVYEKYNIAFANTNFLSIIGNELFVNKEREIQGLLPGYSYLQNKNFTPKFNNYAEIIVTMKNLFFLNKIKVGNRQKYFSSVEEKLKIRSEELDFQNIVETFLTDYKLIFEINLLAGLAVKKVNFLLKKESIKFPDILKESGVFVDLKKNKIKPPRNLRGNSLEIADENNFLAVEEMDDTFSDDDVALWWKDMSNLRKKILQDKIVEAIFYNKLREFGRWLTIKNINSLRSGLLNFAKVQNFADGRNVYFAKIDEVINNQISEKICKQRMMIYKQYEKYSLPNSLKSSYIEREKEIFGVSAGTGEGYLQDIEYLKSKKKHDKKIILYTKILSPELTKYFDDISGIVSENGGMLSHLAIIAREKNIPVVVGVSLKNNAIKLDDFVQIDGSTGAINVISKA